jgi:general secretion pathway protein N
MSRSVLAGTWCGLLLLVLLITAPARLLGHFLPQQQIQAQGFSGSLWHGQAASVAIALPGGWLQLGEVEWRLSPWSLLRLSLRLDLESSWGQQRVQTDISLSPAGSIYLRETSASFSASLIQQWLPVQLDGTLELLIPAAELRDLIPVSGAGRLVWRQASWTGASGSQSLGDYVVEVEIAAEKKLSGVITTLSGPVQVQGSVSLQGRSYAVDVQLRADQGFGREFSNALQLMAAPVDDGYQLKFNSEF